MGRGDDGAVRGSVVSTRKFIDCDLVIDQRSPPLHRAGWI